MSHSPLAVLVEELENLADVDTRAALWAFDVAREGAQAVERCLLLLALEFGNGYVSPICQAFARYEMAVHGVDLTASPADFQLDRIGWDRFSETIARAQRSRAERMARLEERAREHRLVGLRAQKSLSV